MVVAAEPTGVPELAFRGLPIAVLEVLPTGRGHAGSCAARGWKNPVTKKIGGKSSVEGLSIVDPD
ncbi:MAG: hypothetical protein RIT24_94, partial [Planctomycetota bacterium]